MRVTPSEDERAISEVARSLFSTRAPLALTHKLAGSRVDPPRELFKEMGKLDFFAQAVPEHAGGLGLSPLTSGLIVEAAGRELLPGPLIEQLTAIRMTAEHEELRRSLVAGESLAAISFGGPVDDLRLDEDRGTVSGSVRGVGFGDSVDWWILSIPARADPYGATLVVLAPESPGVEVVADAASIDSLWRSDSAQLHQVSPFALIRSRREDVAAHTAYACALVAAYSMGAGQRLLADAVAYVAERRQFGQVVGSFQAVRHHAANAYVALMHARSLTYAALGTEGSDNDRRLARIAADRAYRFIAETAMQMHGGIGFTAESTVHLFLKNSQRLRAWPVPVVTQLESLRGDLGLDGPPGR